MTGRVIIHLGTRTLDFSRGRPLREARLGSLYAGYPVAEACTAAMDAWLRSEGVDPGRIAIGLHVTVAASRKPVDRAKLPPPMGGLVVPPGDRSIEQFGDYLVLCLECPQLLRRHIEYAAMGCAWDHPTYKPHITLGLAEHLPPRGSIVPFDEPITLGTEERTAFD